MSVTASSLSHGARVAFARAHQSLGAQGLLGLLLLVVATAVLSTAWRRHSAPLQTDTAARTAAAAGAASSATPAIPVPPPLLPEVADVPKILARVERAATASGLGWPRADYRTNAATDDLPASVEVRCALKGTYPNLRRFVTALLQDNATLTLKEFSLSRADADAADVDAKIAIVVYLGGGFAASARARP